MAELLDVAVNWGLKTLLGAIVGLQIVRNMVSPVMDAMKRSACWQGSECDSRHWKCSDRCNRISADQCSDGAKQFWRSNRDPSVADWSRTDYPLWKSFSGLSFSGCDCTANF